MRRLSSWSLLFLSQGACAGKSSTGGGDPCAGVTCSAHSTCLVSDGGAACTCNPGYLASGGAYHCYPDPHGGWDIFGSATFDLGSNALRPDGWTSADAAGFPILPLLLRADEASAGAIQHALRFTIQSNHIRIAYVWPARHLTTNGTTSQNQPPMGQVFRLKASYQIPASFNAQATAILQALKTYGMYIADGGSDMYIQGEPSAVWSDSTISQVQSVNSSQFEAVDLSPIQQRSGFDPNSAAVPAP